MPPADIALRASATASFEEEEAFDAWLASRGLAWRDRVHLVQTARRFVQWCRCRDGGGPDGALRALAGPQGWTLRESFLREDSPEREGRAQARAELHLLARFAAEVEREDGTGLSR
jgi:hypothetical protein